MNRHQLVNLIKQRKNFLCVGLDPELSKIPPHLLQYPDPIFEFCKGIIEATSDLVVAYKPNLAFFECLGTKGWHTLEKIMDLIPKHIFTIADAKRGDIGNTSKKYAECFFQYFDFDAVTVAPYMGHDSVEPFLSYSDKWVIVLGLTSNNGSKDFELLPTKNGQLLYEHVLQTVASWGTPDNTMFVIGATQPTYFNRVREILPNHFLLIPGIGAQGGSLDEVSNHCVIKDEVGILVNNGRQIIYASDGLDFKAAARQACVTMISSMENYT